jgi:hypothetical protein
VPRRRNACATKPFRGTIRFDPATQATADHQIGHMSQPGFF